MSYGRRKIFTDAAEITAENVVREVNAALFSKARQIQVTENLLMYPARIISTLLHMHSASLQLAQIFI